LDLSTVETNIVRFKINGISAGEFVDRLFASGLHVLPSGRDGVRVIPYLGISTAQIDQAVKIISSVASRIGAASHTA